YPGNGVSGHVEQACKRGSKRFAGAVAYLAPGIVGFAIFVTRSPGTAGPFEKAKLFAGFEFLSQCRLPVAAIGGGVTSRRSRGRRGNLDRLDGLLSAGRFAKHATDIGQAAVAAISAGNVAGFVHGGGGVIGRASCRERGERPEKRGIGRVETRID